MKNIKKMKWEELQELPVEEFQKIPEEILDAAVREYEERVPQEQRRRGTHDFIVPYP